jgi:hypothetical protein
MKRRSPMKRVSRKLKRNAMLALAVSALAAGAVLATAAAGDRAPGPARTAHSAHVHARRAHAKGRRHRAGTHDGVLELSARYLGVGRSQLHKQLRSGRTLAQIADATSGKSAAGLIDVLVAARSARLSAAASVGALSQQKARTRLANLRSRVTREVYRARPVAGLDRAVRAGAGRF